VKQYGAANGTSNGAGVAVDGSGNVLLTGYYAGTVDFGAGPYVASGVNNTDVVLTKLTSAGVYSWAKHFGGTSMDEGCSVAVDGSGNVVVTGYFIGSLDLGGGTITGPGSADLYLAKYTGSGTYVWGQAFGNTGSDIGYGVTMDGTGKVIITGQFQTSIDF